MPHPSSMRTSSVVRAAAGCALVACGPATGGVGQRGVLADDRLYTSDAPPPTVTVYEAPPSRVWLALESAYKGVGIDVTTQDIAAHTIGNRDFWKMRMLGSTRLSKFVDCGSGQSGSKADQYRVSFSVLSVVTSETGGKTKVETQVVPSAVDVSGGSSDRIPCGSTGELERQLQLGVKAYLTP
jgi:hypothetical protein